jgi:hypothetical protein
MLFVVRHQDMKLLSTIVLLLFWTTTYSQDNALIKVVFKDKSNFDIITSLGGKMPNVFYVLNKTYKWNSYRFHLDADLTSDSVRKHLESDEHSPYNHTYIFKDTLLDRLISESEKQRMYELAQTIKPRQIADTFKLFKLIKSFDVAKYGFFFSVTDPIFTQDRQYAFVDLITLNKDKGTENINSAYFATTLLIYQNIKGKGWTRIQKLDRIIL